MLRKEDYVHIGYVGRSHGVHGEVACKLDVEIAELVEESEGRFFVMLEDSELLIPYRVESHRTKAGDIDLLHFAGIGSKEEVESLSGRPLWLERSYILEEDLSEDPYEYTRYKGFELYTADTTCLVGKVIEVDESTINTLLYVETAEGEELILPIAEELLRGYDDEARRLYLEIPKGLLDDSSEYVD